MGTRVSLVRLALPGSVAQAIHAHLTTYRAGASLDDLVFVTTTGRNIVGGGYRQAIPSALAAIGRSDVRVHGLRHTGSTLAITRSGASLPELMRRMGHGSVGAAQGYLHATKDHGRAVSRKLDSVVTNTKPAKVIELGKRHKAG